MSITISAGSTLLIFFGIIFITVIVMMFLRPGQAGQKAVSLALMAIIFSIVFFVFGGPREITADDTGIHSKAYGKIDFSWTEVNVAEIITGYQNTEWKPSVKINGSAFIGFRAGTFKLSNGKYAKVLTQKSDDAVIFQTDEGIFLFALNDHDAFVEYVSKYINL